MSAHPNPFAEHHFRLHLYATVSRMLAHLDGAGGNVEERDYGEVFPFLNGYRAALQAQQQPDAISNTLSWEEQIAELEARTDAHLPLRSLVAQDGLSAEDARVLIAAGLVEEDIRFGALFATLQAPLQARRPCVGVLGWLLAEPGQPPADAWPGCQRLIERGLLVAENRADPRAEWVLRVPQPIWDVVRGQSPAEPVPGLVWQPAASFPSLSDLILPETLEPLIAHIPDILAEQPVNALVARGMAGSGRRTLLGSIARELGRDVLLWKGGTPGDDAWRMMASLAVLANVMPVLRCSPGPGDSLDLPDLPGYSGPVGVTLGRSGGLRGSLVERALSLNLSPPDLESRRRFWQATDASFEPHDLDQISERLLLTGGHIHRAAALSRAYAALEDRETVTLADVQLATRTLNRESLETLATHLETTSGWSDLVISPATEYELHGLATRCRERERLSENAGPAFDQNLNRGVRAMFSGPSGTGKTLAARALAAELQMDLYRVDLAAVVNKYIGETERNLNQVLSRAEELDVVLLLDEGDALMTRRTDVRNANDRYANLETNYLLQRLETYEGVVIITTNALPRIDAAFLRRIDVIIDFSPPDATERWLIWHSHLPQRHAVSPAFLEEVANRCALNGGQIRNAALHATLLALGEGAPVRDAHVETALQREYRKAGAAYPLRPPPVAFDQMDRLLQFAAELR